MNREELIQQLRNSLPVMWNRKITTELTGGVVHHRTLTNHMSKGTGPGGTFRRGRAVIITKDGFLDWFEQEIEEIKK